MVVLQHCNITGIIEVGGGEGGREMYQKHFKTYFKYVEMKHLTLLLSITPDWRNTNARPDKQVILMKGNKKAEDKHRTNSKATEKNGRIEVNPDCCFNKDRTIRITNTG